MKAKLKRIVLTVVLTLLHLVISIVLLIMLPVYIVVKLIKPEHRFCKAIEGTASEG